MKQKILDVVFIIVVIAIFIAIAFNEREKQVEASSFIGNSNDYLIK